MVIVKAKSLTKKRKLDDKPVGVSKAKKTKLVKQPVVEDEVVLKETKKPKAQKKLKNLISLKKYDAKIDNISTKYKIPVELVESSVSNIVKLVDENPKLQNTLFYEKFAISLQVNLHKIPKCHPRLVRIELEHSLVDSDDEICFIAPDLKEFKNKDYSSHLEYYEELFKKNGITNIKKIITFHQLKSEYENFELKRGLVELYDMFLVDGRISGRTVHQLGKIFYKKKKIPTPVYTETNLKKNIDSALKKTVFQIHSKGDSYLIKIGHNQMTERELVENVFTAIQNLDKAMPGGFNNIRNINVIAPRATSLPIYLSLGKNY